LRLRSTAPCHAWAGGGHNEGNGHHKDTPLHHPRLSPGDCHGHFRIILMNIRSTYHRNRADIWGFAAVGAHCSENSIEPVAENT